MPNTVPLKVTAHLVDGRLLSTDGVVMFDSILYHAWFLKYMPEIFRGEREETMKNIHIGLPLARLETVKGKEQYRASRGVYEEVEKHIEYYNKRPDFFAADKMHHLDMQKGLISDSVGAYRAYRNPVVVRVVEGAKITFYCNGTKDKIEDLLQHIPAAGKKPSMGWGWVSSWDVEEVDNDYSVFHPDYGLMRPIALDDADKYSNFCFEKYPIFQYGVKPPYWKPCNFRACYVPIWG